MKRSGIVAAIVGLASPVYAVDAPPAMTEYAQSAFAEWVTVPVIIDAINAQNAKHAGLSNDDIIAMDNTWRSEVGTADPVMITELLTSEASKHLMLKVGKSQGRITEIFVMDNLGLNVAQSDVTSDYWQGDEAKFQQTFSVGADAMHVGEIELDESTQTYQGQVSMSIVDPATGEVIGAVTFGLNAQAFF